MNMLIAKYIRVDRMATKLTNMRDILFITFTCILSTLI